MTADDDRRPGGNGPATTNHQMAEFYTQGINWGDTAQAVARAVTSTDWEQVARRLIAETIRRQIPAVLDRRADAFDGARPRPGDFAGHAGVTELAARDHRLSEEARRLRRHALLLRSLLDDDLDLLAEAHRLGVS